MRLRTRKVRRVADPVIRSIGLCAGVGMLDLGLSAGLEYLGIRHRTIAYCEREAYAASQLLALMEGECLDAAPIWPDLTTFPAIEFRGVVDCVTAGFPCQPHSVAGKREGTDDARWIWPAIVGIIRDSGAWLVVLENVRGLLSSGGMAPVLADLADLGFDVEWTVLGAGEVGASHRRERVFIVGVAHGHSIGRLENESPARNGQHDADRIGGTMAHPARHGGDGSHRESGSGRGVCGDGGEVADAGFAGHAPRLARNESGEDSETTGGRATDQHGGTCCDLANPSGGLLPQPWRGSQGRDGAGSAVAVLGDSENDQRRGELATGSAECGRAGLAGNGERMADTSGDGLGGCGRSAAIESGQRDDRPLFAPGPSDSRWPRIIRERPDLAPAVESSVRSLAHGMAGMVDESRRDQLRAIGNGVCPLQAAAAIVALLARFDS